MNFEKWFVTDLQQPLTVQELKGFLYTGDEDGNLIGFEVYDGSSAATLSGSCVGYIIRPDGVTVTENGTISGNRVSIVLPAAAYYHEGAIDIVVKVTASGNRVAVGAVRGYVQRATTNVYADPSPSVPIPSVEELLEIIGACEDATTAAETAAGALENMDAVATTLTAGSSATASITTVDGHYRLTLGIPKGDKGDQGIQGEDGEQGEQGETGETGATGATATITATEVGYISSSNGTDIPTGDWSSTLPTVPQGYFLWIRTQLTWNNNQTTSLYSVSRMGIDGSGSVSSVNDVSPDANGNVVLPIDTIPTQDSNIPVTSGALYTQFNQRVAKTGDTMTGDLTAPNYIVKGSASGVVPAVMGRNQNGQSLGTIDFFTNGVMQFRCYNVGVASENYKLPTPTATALAEYDIITSKQLIPWKTTTTWSTAVANAKMDIKMVFDYQPSSLKWCFTIDIPVCAIDSSYKFFFYSFNDGTSSYYAQVYARTASVDYIAIYKNGTAESNTKYSYYYAYR